MIRCLKQHTAADLVKYADLLLNMLAFDKKHAFSQILRVTVAMFNAAATYRSPLSPVTIDQFKPFEPLVRFDL